MVGLFFEHFGPNFVPFRVVAFSRANRIAILNDSEFFFALYVDFRGIVIGAIIVLWCPVAFETFPFAIRGGETDPLIGLVEENIVVSHEISPENASGPFIQINTRSVEVGPGIFFQVIFGRHVHSYTSLENECQNWQRAELLFGQTQRRIRVIGFGQLLPLRFEGRRRSHWQIRVRRARINDSIFSFAVNGRRQSDGFPRDFDVNQLDREPTRVIKHLSVRHRLQVRGCVYASERHVASVLGEAQAERFPFDQPGFVNLSGQGVLACAHSHDSVGQLAVEKARLRIYAAENEIQAEVRVVSDRELVVQIGWAGKDFVYHLKRIPAAAFAVMLVELAPF
mmetsp:Transcript_19402/g.28732  ORF Transcript_19402/g.28732 Transcript_19402/m.28732 type:complete len:338 (+) Transcript_19402:873-1886(+)